jgi:hypothetical protein
LLRACKIGLVVGLVQVAINQGDRWLGLSIDGPVIAKTVLTPLVTLGVAWLSAADTSIRNHREASRERNQAQV